MRAKVICELNTSPKNVEKVQVLASNIKRRHTIIAQESELIEVEKEELKKISAERFFEDMEEDVPEIYNAHEYHVEDGIVRTSFKVKSRPMTEINGKPAIDVVEGLFKEHTEKLFKVSEAYEITALPEDMIAQYSSNPELFDFNLKSGVSSEDMLKMVKAFPEFFEARVNGVEKYAETFPTSVKKNSTVSVKPGFLEALGKAEGSIRKSAKKFVVNLLKPSLSPAVTCSGGDASKR